MMHGTINIKYYVTCNVLEDLNPIFAFIGTLEKAWKKVNTM